MKTLVTLVLVWAVVGCSGAREPASEVDRSNAGAQGYFGAQLGPAPDGAPGVQVVTVLPDSPALSAGIAAGDVIVAMDGDPATDALALAEALRTAGAGASVRFELRRLGPNARSTVTLGPNPWQDVDAADRADGLYGVTERPDIAYRIDDAADPDQLRLDLYRPDRDERVPLMLWMHGGGWSTSDRKADRALALRFAERGVAVASVSYRLSAGSWADPSLPDTGVVHPAHVNDVADAFAWLHTNADQLGLDRHRLFVSGHSSGGHLATLLASDPRYLEARSLSLSDVAGALPIGGTYDIPDYHAALSSGSNQGLAEAHIHAVFGPDREAWLDASPARYLAQSSVPMLVVVEDQPGFQRYARRLGDAADAAGRDNIELFDATGRLHSNVLLMMTRRTPDLVRDRMVQFILATG